MIKVLILSRSDLALWSRDVPQEDFLNYHESHLFSITVFPDITEAHYVIFQEGDGPVTVLRDREDYPIKTLLEEVLRELPKENE